MVKYVYDAWGNHKAYDANGVEITDNGHIGGLNPFRCRSYFYDAETKLYYLQSRYYDPETCRFINMDAIEYADPETDNGLNLFAYCNNNPVMGYDPDGNSWKSFWQKVGNWFSQTFDSVTKLTQKITACVEDNFFGGSEWGFKQTISSSQETKPITFFTTNASEWCRFWEYQVGVDISIGNFRYSSSIGIGEINLSIGSNTLTADLQAGIDRVGVGFSYTEKDITLYYQRYIKTIPTALALVIGSAHPSSYVWKYLKTTLKPILSFF